jgi:archaellum component FlaC
MGGDTMQAPWTEIGRLESDVRDINSKLHQVAQSHEIHQVSSDVGRLEHTVREISATCAGLRNELETMRQEMIELIDWVIEREFRQ